LRLYAQYGLITPGRSARGWRLHGPEDLVRLNAITLLKLAGRTLAQIAGIIDSGSRGPDLKQLLAIQRDNWRARRTEAERGQRIAEAALERLRHISASRHHCVAARGAPRTLGSSRLRPLSYAP
jgi:DNA-binding transcriptional MerR regulator